MIVEIIATGTELLLGQIINTNTPFLSGRLNALGFNVLYHSTVGDNRLRMSQVLQTALERADIIITSGGLGPTLGDITKEVTAQLLGLPMELHEGCRADIEAFFARRGITMTDNNLRQAMLPAGAIPVKNSWGTAPAVILEHNGKTIIHLPGPPHELEPLFDHMIAPYLSKRFAMQGVIVSRILRTYNIGESALEDKIKSFILKQSNPTIALLAGKGEVIIRLTAKGSDTAEAELLISSLENQLRQHIAEYIWGFDNDTIEANIGTILTEKQLTIALAESCTGGLITSRLTDVAGSSCYIQGSIVCYTNDIKTQFVGVPEVLLKQHGAVSQEVAVAMAAGIRKEFSAAIGMGITGIAGPGGGSEKKPVGTVCIAIDGPQGTVCRQYAFHGSRTDIKHRSAQAALYMLRQYALSL